MNAVSFILYIAAGFAGILLFTRLVMRTLKVLLLILLGLFAIWFFR